MYRKLISVIVFFLLVHDALSQTPVMLRVVRSEQHDTLGCNVVSEVTSLVHKLVMEGRIKLWDSPLKVVEISPASLKQLELTGKTSFIDQEIIYIYEYWSFPSRNPVVVNGISFSSKTKSGSPLSYGYVDFNNVKGFASGKHVYTNPNGGTAPTLVCMLNSNRFYYHIIQYGKESISNIKDSEHLKAWLNFQGKLTFTDCMHPDEKTVQWRFDERTDSINFGKLNKALENYFELNREVYLNLGGDKISAETGNGKPGVTAIEVIEKWKKEGGSISYEIDSITIYINNLPLAVLPYTELSRMDVTIDGKSWTAFIKEKQFSFIITRINDSLISAEEAPLYLLGLQTYEWNKLTEFVRYY